jgi:hypothetical protein
MTKTPTHPGPDALNRLMPEPLFDANVSNFTIGQLVLGDETEDRIKSLYEPGQWLMGWILPPFQRPLVWSTAQKTRFIESAWLGFHLGTYIVNDADRFDGRNGRPHFTDRWLIDGQQRLNAIRGYIHDEFPVFGYRWSEITELDRRRFRSIVFACGRVQLNDEAKLRDLYDRLNFGGTAHTEDQRATK